MACRALKFTTDAQEVPAGEEVEIYGLTYTGFTSVSVYNGTSASDNLVAAGGAGPVTITFNDPIRCDLGVFIDVAGSGSGSLFV